MSPRRTLPGLPGLDPVADPQLARVVAPIKEIIEVREGLRGNPLERFATLADLVALGLATQDQVLRLDAQ